MERERKACHWVEGLSVESLVLEGLPVEGLGRSLDEGLEWGRSLEGVEDSWRREDFEEDISIRFQN